MVPSRVVPPISRNWSTERAPRNAVFQDTTVRQRFLVPSTAERWLWVVFHRAVPASQSCSTEGAPRNAVFQDATLRRGSTEREPRNAVFQDPTVRRQFAMEWRLWIVSRRAVQHQLTLGTEQELNQKLKQVFDRKRGEVETAGHGSVPDSLSEAKTINMARRGTPSKRVRTNRALTGKQARGGVGRLPPSARLPPRSTNSYSPTESLRQGNCAAFWWAQSCRYVHPQKTLCFGGTAHSQAGFGRRAERV